MTDREEKYAIEAFQRHLKTVTDEYFKGYTDYYEIIDIEKQGWHFFIDLSTLEISYLNEETLEKEEFSFENCSKFKGYYCINMWLFLQRGLEGLHIDWDGLNRISYDCVTRYISRKRIKEYSEMPECCQIPAEEIAKRKAATRAYEEELERRRLEAERVRAEHAFNKNAELLALIIPDVHGRTFWKDAVARFPDIPVIFLGDYLDPYQNHLENINRKEAIENFKELLDYAHCNTDNVTLLLGNHDIHYLSPDLDCSRKDMRNAFEIERIYEENMEFFKIATCLKTDKGDVLFSHAGILPGWLDLRMPDVQKDDCQSICNALNQAAKDREFLLQMANDASYQRGGRIKFGSPLWADVTEHDPDDASVRLSGNVCQIFGHTQQEENPIYKEWYCCLDCRRAFALTKSGFLMEI